MSDEAGLFSALNWYVHGIAEHSGIAIDLRASNKTLSDDHGLFKPRNPKGGPYLGRASSGSLGGHAQNSANVLSVIKNLCPCKAAS